MLSRRIQTIAAALLAIASLAAQPSTQSVALSWESLSPNEQAAVRELRQALRQLDDTSAAQGKGRFGYKVPEPSEATLIPIEQIWVLETREAERKAKEYEALTPEQKEALRREDAAATTRANAMMRESAAAAEPVVRELVALNARVETGVTYDDYVDGLRRIQDEYVAFKVSQPAAADGIRVDLDLTWTIQGFTSARSYWDIERDSEKLAKRGFADALKTMARARSEKEQSLREAKSRLQNLRTFLVAANGEASTQRSTTKPKSSDPFSN